jgi:DNA-binding transcriptional LysR family regulator
MDRKCADAPPGIAKRTDSAASTGTVNAVLQDWHLPPIDLCAVFPAGRRASAKARAFASVIEANLSAPRVG